MYMCHEISRRLDQPPCVLYWQSLNIRNDCSFPEWAGVFASPGYTFPSILSPERLSQNACKHELRIIGVLPQWDPALVKHPLTAVPKSSNSWKSTKTWRSEHTVRGNKNSARLIHAPCFFYQWHPRPWSDSISQVVGCHHCWEKQGHTLRSNHQPAPVPDFILFNPMVHNLFPGLPCLVYSEATARIVPGPMPPEAMNSNTL